MGPQVETVLRAALADLAVNDNALLNGIRWVNECYEDLCSRRLKQRRRVGEVIVHGAISAGLATVTQGSAVVTFDADGLTAIELNDLPGRYFQIASNPGGWYGIGGFNGTSGELTLSSPYTDTSGELAFRIVQRYVSLAPQTQFLGAFALPRRQRLLEFASATELDRAQPGRFYNLGTPVVVVDCGESDEGARQVEIYPYSTQDELITYTYWEKVQPLTKDDFLPQSITVASMKEGVLVGVMRWKMAQAVEKGKIEEAALWRNEYRAQQTKWDREIQKLVKMDQGVEDITLLLQSRFSRLSGSYDIRNAHDEVWSRG